MPDNALTFSLIPRLSRSNRRGVGFLEGHTELNAATAFRHFPDGAEKMRAFMDSWIAGHDGPKTRFHGFTQDDYRNCFVFKDRQKRVHHRLYGFLCHPHPKSNPRFELCVLAIHATKNERETDVAELDRVNQWRTNQNAREAIAKIFSEYRSGVLAWRK